jgi:predicted ATPase
MEKPMSHERFHVFTGGPGAGKTTLLNQLAARGHAVMDEAGRGIIRHQVATGGGALPWADREKFAELMLSWEMRSRDLAERHPGPVLFDRAIPDVVGYLRLSGLPVPDHALKAAQNIRYAPRVFILPFWPEIFAEDAERKQSPAEAKATCRVMAETYRGFGYDLVEVPVGPVERRAEFVASMIAR